MKRTTSLRTRLVIIMSILVLIQSVAFAFSLRFSHVYSTLNEETHRLFSQTADARVQEYNSAIGKLAYGVAKETEELAAELSQLSEQQGIRSVNLHRENETYLQAALTGMQSVMRLLQRNTVTGAFFVLNGSNAHPEDIDAHSAVYIRNSSPGSASFDMDACEIEVGPSIVAQLYQMTTAVNWSLDLSLDSTAGGFNSFYQMPVAAALANPGSELERYGHWSTPIDVLGDKVDAVYYTVPLLDDDGTPFGVMGVEIALNLFAQAYLPNSELPYNNSFYAIASVEEGEILLDWVIPSGPVASVYLTQGAHMEIGDSKIDGFCTVEVPGLGEMCCYMQPLRTYSANSPFADEVWTLLGFVPREVMHEAATSVNRNLNTSLVVAAVIAFVLIFFLSSSLTTRISGLSKYVEGLSPNQEIRYEPTGMREIDDLVSALSALNRNVRKAERSISRMLELTLLPIGGFDVSEDMGYVTLTEFVRSLLDIPSNALITNDVWDKVFAILISKPAPGYENIYQFSSLDHPDVKWLRIVTATTPGGVVGVIVDVTKDIEEHRRLAHELDFDALTHLYNRDAFKREAYAKITKEPQKLGAMIFADLDNLKQINDTYGHDTGDMLIMQAGKMFSQFEKYGGLAARISGDEFAVFLHGYETEDELRKVISEQYRMNQEFILTAPDGKRHYIKYSSGMSWYPKDAADVTDLLKLADFAMYEAKHTEKGAFFEFDPETYSENMTSLERRETISRFLDDAAISFAYQPIVNVKTGDVFGYELLMRSLEPKLNTPMDILAAAASHSKLGQLESLVMLKAFESISENASIPGDAKLFINSIPSQTLPSDEMEYLRNEYPDIFERVLIEITAAEGGTANAVSKFGFISETGMGIAVDGYVPTEKEKMPRVPEKTAIVKLDMSIMQGIHASAGKQVHVRELVEACHENGILIVAEGIEDYDDLAAVSALGIDYAQGYYLGRPDMEVKGISSTVRLELRKISGED